MNAAFLALLAVVQAAPLPAPTCSPATGFMGTICTTARSEKHPAILLLGGSEGGNSLGPLAMRYAQLGYVAASVAYFGLPGLPQTLQGIPVEIVGRALAAIEKRDDVDPGRIAIFGVSKGGELALLAASTYPEIHAVIADVPSPFAWEGIAAGPSTDRKSSWTLNAKPLPYVPYADAMGRAFSVALSAHTPLDLRLGYDDAMSDRAAIERAFFPLEKINGPVFFLSAGDDRIWNSEMQSTLGIAYLKNKHHRFADTSTIYPAAGHLFIIATPERPLIDAPFSGGLQLLFGGTAKANVAAATDAWPHIFTFLETALHAR